MGILQTKSPASKGKDLELTKFSIQNTAEKRKQDQAGPAESADNKKYVNLFLELNKKNNGGKRERGIDLGGRRSAEGKDGQGVTGALFLLVSSKGR